MNVTINGENRSVNADTTVFALLEELSLKPEATVVQYNNDILDRSTYPHVKLVDGDVLELVRFVGGG